MDRSRAEMKSSLRLFTWRAGCSLNCHVIMLIPRRLTNCTRKVHPVFQQAVYLPSITYMQRTTTIHRAFMKLSQHSQLKQHLTASCQVTPFCLMRIKIVRRWLWLICVVKIHMWPLRSTRSIVMHSSTSCTLDTLEYNCLLLFCSAI